MGLIHTHTGVRVEVVSAANSPKGTEVEEFVQNKDGTSTLRIRCTSNRIVTFTIRTDKVKNLNVDGIYSILLTECVR